MTNLLIQDIVVSGCGKRGKRAMSMESFGFWTRGCSSDPPEGVVSARLSIFLPPHEVRKEPHLSHCHPGLPWLRKRSCGGAGQRGRRAPTWARLRRKSGLSRRSIRLRFKTSSRRAYLPYAGYADDGERRSGRASNAPCAFAYYRSVIGLHDNDWNHVSRRVCTSAQPGAPLHGENLRRGPRAPR